LAARAASCAGFALAEAAQIESTNPKLSLRLIQTPTT
jgi:hypothetical protein